MGPRRRKYLVDKPLQLTFAGLTIWLISITILLVGVATYYLTLNTILDDLERSGSFTGNAYNLVMETNATLTQRVGVLLVTSVVVAGMVQVFFLHRIVGPILRMKKTLSELEAGQDVRPIVLRKNDYFGDLAAQLNRLIERDRAREAELQELRARTATEPRPAGSAATAAGGGAP